MRMLNEFRQFAKKFQIDNKKDGGNGRPFFWESFVPGGE
jgi:hypothetical protein